MRIDIITLFPEQIQHWFEASILKRAIELEKISIQVHNLRTYTSNNYRSVDDYAYGGGAGMVMMIEPIDRCITQLRAERNYDEVIYMTPDADLLTQKTANELSIKQNLIILCGHYKGVDQRVRDHLITREISIGDYVMTGGELASVVLCDTMIRLIPGVLGDETSALTDSFQDNLLSPPIYTRPSVYKGLRVPKILLSGNQRKIDEWREEKALQITRERRSNLLKEGFE